MSPSSFVIEPPAQTRFKESSADPAIVAGMSGEVKPGTYVTNGVVYKTDKEASNESQVYRRAVAAALGVEAHTVVSKSWGVKDGVIIADRDTPGEWRFALTLDPSRQKRERKAKAAA